MLSAGLKKAFQPQNGHNHLISQTPPSAFPVFHHMLFPPLQTVNFLCARVCNIRAKGLQRVLMALSWRRVALHYQSIALTGKVQ